MDDVSAAKILISSIDLTSLNLNDTDETIRQLCQNAFTPYGSTASVCIYPQFIPYAKNILPSDFPVATVINFPSGIADIHLLEKETEIAIKLGADELDIVFPYRTFLNNDIEFCQKYLNKARSVCGNKTMKIIIETGELKNIPAIKKASELCIESQTDFIKTSTGKTSVSATPEAANAILETISQSGKKVGFKASGGIRTFTEAKKYLSLFQSIIGPKDANQSRFRIGASSVLADIINTIKQGY